jgi:hypothetical protein
MAFAGILLRGLFSPLKGGGLQASHKVSTQSHYVGLTAGFRGQTPKPTRMWGGVGRALSDGRPYPYGQDCDTSAFYTLHSPIFLQSLQIFPT